MAHRARPQPSAENDLVAFNASDFRVQCVPYLTCGPQPYRAIPVPSSQSASSSSVNTPSFTRTPAAGSLPVPGYAMNFSFDDSLPTLIQHSPSLDLHRNAENDYQYDPNLFDGVAQFIPAVSAPAAATTTASPDGLDMMALQPAFGWQHPTHNGRQEIEGPMLAIHSTSDIGSMPTAPGMSNFEPMIQTWETHRASLEAIHAATPSPSMSSVASMSPGSSVTPTSSERERHNMLGQQPPDSVQIPAIFELDVRFEQIPGSQTKNGKSPTANTNRASRGQTSNKRKLETKATEKAALSRDIRDISALSRETNYKAKKRASTVSVDLVSSEHAAQFLSSRSSTIVATRDGSPRGSATSPEIQIQSGEKIVLYGSLPFAAGDFAQSPRQGSQRERNRTAATKCRAKTKAEVALLEATERTISAQHSELLTQVMDLRGQVVALKNELLRHGNCDCEIIKRYITSEATKIQGGTIPTIGTGQYPEQPRQ